jgi:hypothetical protein
LYCLCHAKKTRLLLLSFFLVRATSIFILPTTRFSLRIPMSDSNAAASGGASATHRSKRDIIAAKRARKFGGLHEENAEARSIGGDAAEASTVGAQSSSSSAAAAAAATTAPRVEQTLDSSPVSPSSEEDEQDDGPPDVATRRANRKFIRRHYKCPICLGMIRHCVETACGHTFCQPCIAEWFLDKSRKKCPACREPVTRTTTRVFHVDRLIRKIMCETVMQKDEHMARMEAAKEEYEDVCARKQQLAEAKEERSRREAEEVLHGSEFSDTSDDDDAQADEDFQTGDEDEEEEEDEEGKDDSQCESALHSDDETYRASARRKRASNASSSAAPSAPVAGSNGRGKRRRHATVDSASSRHKKRKRSSARQQRSKRT